MFLLSKFFRKTGNAVSGPSKNSRDWKRRFFLPDFLLMENAALFSSKKTKEAGNAASWSFFYF